MYQSNRVILLFVTKYPSIHVVEYIGAYNLKRYHTPQRAPLHVILEEPHTWVTHHESALPSDVIF